jgi:tetratricopeptide (TPR) repeat protein
MSNSKGLIKKDATENSTVAQRIAKKLNQAFGLHNAGELEKARAAYEEILKLNPKHFDALQLAGLVAAQTRQWEKALSLFAEALNINAANAAVYNYRGIVLNELERVEDALKSYGRAIELNSAYTEAYFNRGIALQKLKQFEASVASHDAAIALKPHFYEAHLSRGIALQELKQFDAAVASYDKAIALKPDYAEAYSNRGISLKELKQFDAAVASYDKAISLKPDYVEAHSNRGNVLKELKQFDAAIASYDKAISLKPDYAEAYFNRGILKLTLKDFCNGFLDYKHRWLSKNYSNTPLKTTIPSASKVGLNGRLLIWAEQGIGDEIFYASFIPRLASKNVSITLSADKRLHPIYRQSFPEVELVDRNTLVDSSIDSGFDAQAPIADLGLLLSANEIVFRGTRPPYLQSNPVKRESYRKTISTLGSGLVCGVSWKSGSKTFGTPKSTDLESFAPILGLTGINFLNLQYGDVEEEIQHVKSTLSFEVHQVPSIDVFNDIESLLALIDICDVVITTSNVTAHLAGSIGKRAAVLVPHSAGKFWYWHEDDEYSFWYPSLKLFYQNDMSSWDQTIEACSDWVRSLL